MSSKRVSRVSAGHLHSRRRFATAPSSTLHRTSAPTSHAVMQGGKFKFAGIQLDIGKDKEANLKRARAAIDAAAKQGANFISLPECFNSPYGVEFFGSYAESVPGGPSAGMLSEAAKSNGVWLVGGSVPEREGEKLYNTATVWNPKGELVATHRKLHLFDIDIPGKMTFKESEVLTAGQSPTIFDTEAGRIGLGICYDLRFAEMALWFAKKGCKMILYPGAFNTTTGPLHWELLLRARAVDNQVYVAAVSPARSPSSKYQAWGHSTVVDPWGAIVATTEHSEATIFAQIDFAKVDEVRGQIPVTSQRKLPLLV